ncbi:MFS transporter [Aliidiomarina iranensis]|uniref:MFS transporter n=1 Tax=Aliidiomarina iranensis TaxID=1434071 RepID=A0A432VSN2_9GAMM|nr:MFS transporter [Aliidiomarina iranensis]RUO19354.1 MFS transporter [Aliidiomarina iranensis]
MNNSRTDQPPIGFRNVVRFYCQRRLITIFLLGMASGYPWVMIGSSMSAWLNEMGFTRSTIGFFGVVFAAYSVNFLWSPLVDRVKIPLLSNWLGHRRGWILFCQLGIALSCFVLAQMNFTTHLYWAGLVALVLAVFSATQDISIDAYRIDSVGEHEARVQSAGAAMTTAGWWTGFAGLGAIPFFLSDMPGWDWPRVYQYLAALMLVLSAGVWLAREPKTARGALQKEAELRYQQVLAGVGNRIALRHKITAWLGVTLVEPLAEFFRRSGVKFALSILLFVLLFKVGEAFLGRMSIVFYQEVGFSNSDIAWYSKIVSWWVTIIFALLGSYVTMRIGILKGLFIGGTAMAASNLFFAVLALVGPNKGLLLAAVITDGFTSAWSTVAFVALISLLANRAFTATQYALMASVGTLGRTVLATYSGAVVDWLDGNWALFFVLTTLMVIPSLLFLWTIRKPIQKLEDDSRDRQQQWDSEQAVKREAESELNQTRKSKE